MLRASLVPAFVLHTRAYRNTSLIVDFFTLDYGRISAVAKSARGPKSRYRGLLQPFTQLHIDFVGDGDLKTLGNIELADMPITLKEKRLFCGYYLNEMLMRLFAKDDAHEAIFSAYHQTLCELAEIEHYELCLRRFEWQLLECLGWLPAMDKDCHGHDIAVDANYQLVADRGFQCVNVADDARHYIFRGQDIKQMAEQQLDDHVLLLLKHMNRYLLQSHLGDKPIFSRRLIQDLI